MSILTIDEIPIAGKRVFIRVDFNVPLNKQGEVTDTTRIDKALPTIEYALKKGARVILGSHLGRPKGIGFESAYSMEPVGRVLAQKLGHEVLLADSPTGDSAIKLAAELKEGEILLLENLRFNEGEKKNNEQFSRELASLADVYVNDAFGTAHRAHASTSGMVSHFEYRAAGFLMKKEVEFFERLLLAPEKPFCAILGGAKVTDKVAVIKNLMERVDSILIGGAMANTFLAAKGIDMGASRVEEDKLGLCRELMDAANARNIEFLLPVDLVLADSLEASETRRVGIEIGVPEGLMALDVGPKTREAFAAVIAKASTIFWNGPMGVFENPALAEGTLSVARAVAESKALSVVGGGDSVAAIGVAGVADKISHVSTGGGASLEIMEGKNLPGIMALL
ncbi:phosphoglycerate kinase [Myxococcota bacterium]|nr:phosphoglycerate kinase [Myxococcota bacterium]MBU1534485.1 phosphoglycerate kinase [Myxococcota bacterium]